MSAVDKRDRLAAAAEAMHEARRAYVDATIEAAYRLQGLLDHDDQYTREVARTANATVIRARSAWLAAGDIYGAIKKESE